MKRGIFFDMFPFSVIFRRDMTMYRIGDGLKEVFSDLQGKKVNEEFTLVRPMLEFSWDNVSTGGEREWDEGSVTFGVVFPLT
jgi:guanylate cyclase